MLKVSRLLKILFNSVDNKSKRKLRKSKLYYDMAIFISKHLYTNKTFIVDITSTIFAKFPLFFYCYYDFYNFQANRKRAEAAITALYELLCRKLERSNRI